MITRITQLTMTEPGEPLFAAGNIVLTIEDEAAGEYVLVSQLSDEPAHKDYPWSIAVDPKNWPAIREAIDRMVEEIQNHETKVDS